MEKWWRVCLWVCKEVEKKKKKNEQKEWLRNEKKERKQSERSCRCGGIAAHLPHLSKYSIFVSSFVLLGIFARDSRQ